MLIEFCHEQTTMFCVQFDEIWNYENDYDLNVDFSRKYIFTSKWKRQKKHKFFTTCIFFLKLHAYVFFILIQNQLTFQRNLQKSKFIEFSFIKKLSIGFKIVIETFIFHDNFFLFVNALILNDDFDSWNLFSSNNTFELCQISTMEISSFDEENVNFSIIKFNDFDFFQYLTFVSVSQINQFEIITISVFHTHSISDFKSYDSEIKNNDFFQKFASVVFKFILNKIPTTPSRSSHENLTDFPLTLEFWCDKKRITQRVYDDLLDVLRLLNFEKMHWLFDQLSTLRNQCWKQFTLPFIQKTVIAVWQNKQFNKMKLFIQSNMYFFDLWVLINTILFVSNQHVFHTDMTTIVDDVFK